MNLLIKQLLQTTIWVETMVAVFFDVAFLSCVLYSAFLLSVRLLLLSWWILQGKLISCCFLDLLWMENPPLLHWSDLPFRPGRAIVFLFQCCFGGLPCCWCTRCLATQSAMEEKVSQWCAFRSRYDIKRDGPRDSVHFASCLVSRDSLMWKEDPSNLVKDCEPVYIYSNKIIKMTRKKNVF